MIEKVATALVLVAACSRAEADRPTEPEAPRLVSAGPRAEAPAGWRSYTSEEFRFAFEYPTELIAAEIRETESSSSEPIFKVRVLGPEEAAPELRPYAIGRFSVDVLANPRKLAVRDWLDTHGWPFGPENRGRPAEVGGLPALDVTTGRELAPNRFFYVSRDDVVLRIAPIGAESERILESFRFLQ